jgi:serine phosphatase RsbU (regulator of sigma subunit)
MPPTSDIAASPWAVCALSLVPGVALVGVATVVGPRSVVGLIFLGAAAVVHAAMLLLVVPRIFLRVAGPSPSDVALTRFLERALDTVVVDEVAEEFVACVHAALGPTRAVLVAPSADGSVRLLPTEGGQPKLGDADAAFLWLGAATEPLHQSRLAGATGEGAAAASVLLTRLGGEVLLPLRHRGLLLGLGVIGPPSRPLARPESFYRALRAYAAVAIANTYLDAEARGRPGLAQNLGLANAVQEALMPAERPVRRERYGLRGVFRPMADCGGDLWLWRELAGEKVLLVIADATGHGAAPALLAAVAKGAIDGHWQLFSGDLDPGKLLAATNRVIHRTGRRRYLMTAFAAVIDTVSGELRFANAGQNFPLVMNARGFEQLIARGNTLGSTADAVYQTQRRTLAPGDRLLLYTDGIIDAGSPHREPFGERRFRAALAGQHHLPAHRVPDLLLQRVDEHLEGRPLGDDVTCVVFELGAGGGEDE